MAKILDIKYDKEELPRYKVYFYLENPTIAKHFSIKFVGFVRQSWRALELYCKGNILILDGPIADEEGVVICKQQKKVEKVAEILKSYIQNDIPGFKERIGQIIRVNPKIDNQDFDIVEVLEIGLKRKTKERFMAEQNYQILAKIIKKVIESGPYTSPDMFDEQVNSIFDKEIEDYT